MILGDQRPRLESVPKHVTLAEELTAFGTSASTDAIELAHIAGLDLDDWQDYVLTNSLYKRPDGKWAAFLVKLLVSRQNGKGNHAVTTPVLTTDGWSTFADIIPGREVYGSNGKPVKVLAVSPVYPEDECYRITFTDGSSYVVGQDHLWYVKHKSRNRWQNTSTSEIARSVGCRRSDNGRMEYNWRVRCDAQVDTPDASLPIDPYLLGYWLGDGSSGCSRITVGHEDLEYVKSFLPCVTSIRLSSHEHAWQVEFNLGKRYDFRNGFLAKLRELGVFGNKHIPEIYLTASIDQRKALLAGLMDSDGSIRQNTQSSQVEFTTSFPDLADDFLRLVRSLGVRVTRHDGKTACNGKRGKNRARFLWTPTFNPFRLPRKANLYVAPRSLRQELMSIMSAERVPSVPTRCIQVDAGDGVYLVGRNFTPTHNSILEARELAGLYLFRTDRLLIHTAHEHKTSSEHYNRVWSLIQNTPDLEKRVSRHSSAYGRELIQLRAGPTVILGPGGHQVLRNESSRLLFIARTGGSGLGFTADFIVYDEDMKLTSAQTGASLPAMGARPNPQAWFTGSAGDKDSEQLAHIRRQGVDAAEGLRPPGRMYFAEWSINWHTEYCGPDCTEHDDPSTEESVAKANPSYNIRRMPDAIEAERETLTAEQFNRQILGVGEYPSPLDGWFTIPKKWFSERFDNADNPPRVTSPVFSIEVAHDRSSSAISVAGLRPDRLTGVQVVEYKNGTGWLIERVKEIHERWKPVKWVIDKRAATNTVISDLEREGIPLELMTASDVAAASGQLYDAFRDDTIRHYGQSSFRSALAASDWRKLGESRAFDRLNPATDQTPLMSVAFAHWGYLRFGVEEDYDASESVHFDLAEIKRLYRMGVYGPDDIRRLYDEDLITDDDLRELADAGIRF